MHQSATSDKTQRLEWSNWAKGDTFSFGLEDVAAVDQDAYQAVNMQVYGDGTLGVRPWWKLLNHPSSTSSGMILSKTEGDNTLLYLGDRAYNPSTGNWSPFVLSAAPMLPALLTYIEYRNRYYGFDTSPGLGNGRVYYSDLGSVTFPATNTFDLVVVGPTAPKIVGMWSTNNALMFCLADGQWFALSGEDPETGSVRDLGIMPILRGTGISSDGDGISGHSDQGGVVAISPSGTSTVRADIAARPGTGWPSSSELKLVRRAEVPMTDWTPWSLKTDDTGPYARHWYNFEKVNDVWNYQALFAVSDLAGSPIAQALDTFSAFIMEPFGSNPIHHLNRWLLTRIRLGTSTYLFMIRDIRLDRPSGAHDINSARIEQLGTYFGSQPTWANHQSAGHVRLRKVAAPDGGRLRIRRVYVDCRYWKDDPNNYVTPAMTCQAVTPTTTQDATTTWSGGSLANADTIEGGSTRITFLLPEAVYEDWAQVRLNGIQSLSIKRVTVEYEIIDAIDGA